MRKLALFDLDGTLVDTSGINYCAYQDALNYYGYELNYDFFCRECNGRHYKYFLPLLGLEDSEVVEAVHRRKKDVYRKYLNQSRLNEYLVSMLNHMDDNFAKVVVTTASRENTKDILRYYDLENKFDLLITQEDIDKPKPNPEGFLLAMEKLQAKPEDTIIFEDSDVGIEAALMTGAAVFKICRF
jgi:beta-phosphoglucomutase